MNKNQLFQQAQQAHQAGQLPQAETLYRQTLHLDRSFAPAHQFLGLVYAQQQRWEEGLVHLREATRLKPKDAAAWINRGEAERRAGLFTEAEASFRQGLACQPQSPEGWFNLGVLLGQRHDLNGAISCYEKALEQQPGHTQAAYNLGNTFLALGKFRTAQECFQHALRWNPSHASAWVNLAVTHREFGEHADAHYALRKALHWQPDSLEAIHNLAQLEEAAGHGAETHAYWQHMARLRPQDDLLQLRTDLVGPIIPLSQAAITRYRAQLQQRLQAPAPQITDPQKLLEYNLAPPMTWTYQGESNRALKEAYARYFSEALQPLPAPARNQRPRIGFVVTRGHEGVFIKCLVRLVNELAHSSELDVRVVCSDPIGPQVLRPMLAAQVRLEAIPPELLPAAQHLHGLAFDLLIYWEVGTDGMNYFLPFLKPARLQAATWGWPDTSGNPRIDFFLSSEGLEPSQAQLHYTEQLVTFPRLLSVYTRPDVPLQVPAREALGLPDGHLYLCTQNLRKLHPDFDAWALGVLQGDPHGQLLLIGDERPEVTRTLRTRLEVTLADVADRMHILPRMPAPRYLQVVASVDVILDSPHYSGGANTNADAFACGVPVVTLPGAFHRGCYTQAAYAQMGVTGLVASTPEEYVAIALRLTQDPTWRQEKSAQIRAAAGALFEDRQTVADLRAWLLKTL
jgi:protein O-GlcNAc transferase